MEINGENAPTYMILTQIGHVGKCQAWALLEEFGLKPGQAGILFALSCEGKLSQRELAGKIGITPPSMTVALRKMEELGYVMKEPDEKDQRIIRILLTEKGQNCVENINNVMKKMETILYKNISSEERLLLRRLLLEMRKNLMDSKEINGINMEEILLRRPHPPGEGSFRRKKGKMTEKGKAEYE